MGMKCAVRNRILHFFLLWVILVVSSPVIAQGTVFSYPPLNQAKDSLCARLIRLNGVPISPIPPVYVDTSLPSNARFVRDTIFIGPLQRDFHTFGDTLSLIYHEYLHKVFWEEQRYPFITAANGKPIQWNTGTFYTYTPHPGQTARDLENLRFYYARVEPDLAGEALDKRLQQMKKVLQQPQELPFVYAPSNLALEELHAYKGQLEGEQMGLYQLSETARNSIKFRIFQLGQTYNLRKAYEQQEGLGPDGEDMN